MSHSCVIHPELKARLSHALAEGKYSRMFPDLPALVQDESLSGVLGRKGAALDAGDGVPLDNPRIPAGFAFLGQFVAHDITRDISLLQHHDSLGELRNFRAPRLDLESVYGLGPSNAPYLYDRDDPDKFLIGLNDAGQPDDVPRNAQGIALIADPRDDTHVIAAQLHLVFMKFHNAIVDRLRSRGMPSDAVFAESQRTARWHYQWIIVQEFLGLSVGDDLVSEILREGPKFFSVEGGVSIPVEFADAAYRFGHPQIRPTYRMNTVSGQHSMFPDLAGFRPIPAALAADWSLFFALDARPAPQASKRIEPRLAGPLMRLPEAMVGAVAKEEEASLAYRDLERGRDCDLPSGEGIARLMGVEPLTREEVGLEPYGWSDETPLWYYILREAELRHAGERLGAVGGRIVAEVLLGLLLADPTSYLGAKPDWKPVLPSSQEGEFRMADLLAFAGVA
jgi:Animal haem peroxidase